MKTDYDENQGYRLNVTKFNPLESTREIHQRESQNTHMKNHYDKIQAIRANAGNSTTENTAYISNEI